MQATQYFTYKIALYLDISITLISIFIDYCTVEFDHKIGSPQY